MQHLGKLYSNIHLNQSAKIDFNELCYCENYNNKMYVHFKIKWDIEYWLLILRKCTRSMLFFVLFKQSNGCQVRFPSNLLHCSACTYTIQTFKLHVFYISQSSENIIHCNIMLHANSTVCWPCTSRYLDRWTRDWLRARLWGLWAARERSVSPLARCDRTVNEALAWERRTGFAKHGHGSTVTSLQ